MHSFSHQLSRNSQLVPKPSHPLSLSEPLISEMAWLKEQIHLCIPSNTEFWIPKSKYDEIYICSNFLFGPRTLIYGHTNLSCMWLFVLHHLKENQAFFCTICTFSLPHQGLRWITKTYLIVNEFCLIRTAIIQFSIRYLVSEGMHRCICSFNHAISKLRGSESDNGWLGFVPHRR